VIACCRELAVFFKMHRHSSLTLPQALPGSSWGASARYGMLGQ
jgi:hypothetical protein